MDPMPGLFIQRQAEALAVRNHVVVLSVIPDPDCPNRYETEYCMEGAVTVIRTYFHQCGFKFPLVTSITGVIRFFHAYVRGIEMLGEFRPDIVHAHILTRTGLMAYYLSRKLRVPYLISEHWSRYFPENGAYRGWLRKRITGFIIQKSSGLIAVSGLLKEAMIRCGLSHHRFGIIPNVVDTRIFFPAEKTSDIPARKMIHISCFEDRSKNISGFLQVLKRIKESGVAFSCDLVGEGPDLATMKALADRMGLIPPCVNFPGLLEGVTLADAIREADFSVLSSRYETFGTVVVESLACGTPVVATRVGIVPEVVDETNGIVVPPDDPDAMYEALVRMLEISGKFDPAAVSRTVENRFTPKTISAALKNIYTELPK
jgi:glycosyltransferase involved in cell wall biosynthesis